MDKLKGSQLPFSTGLKSAAGIESRKITIAISGPTSSGKTTLANLLATVFSTSFSSGTYVIHQDDFFLPKNTVPSVSWRETVSNSTGNDHSVITKYGPHADCLEALDWQRFSRKVVENLDSSKEDDFRMEKANGQNLYDEEEENRIRELEKKHRRIQAEHVFQIPVSVLRNIKSRIKSRLRGIADINTRVDFPGQNVSRAGFLKKDMVIVEGFILFPNPEALRFCPACDMHEGQKCEARNQLLNILSNFDIKLFIPQEKDICKARRFSRREYVDVTLGGQKQIWETWKSEEYFDQVAWPEYEKLHSWLQEEADEMQGEENTSVEMERTKRRSSGAQDLGMKLCSWSEGPDMAGNVEMVLEWAVDVILNWLQDVEYKARHEFFKESQKRRRQNLQI